MEIDVSDLLRIYYYSIWYDRRHPDLPEQGTFSYTGLRLSFVSVMNYKL